jgi:hypothetical protein
MTWGTKKSGAKSEAIKQMESRWRKQKREIAKREATPEYRKFRAQNSTD